MIPKAKDLDTSTLKKGSPVDIIPGLIIVSMSSTIQLYRQSLLRAVEIEYVGAKWSLTPKLETAQLTSAQQVP